MWVLIMLVPAGIAVTVLNGWVLSILWQWFAVSLFGAPVLSVPEAIGVSLVVGYMTQDAVNKEVGKNERFETFVVLVITHTIRPLIYLGFGWVVLQFM